MNNAAVIGLGAGDCGKGVVTDWLCSKEPKKTLVVRFSGGHQAAHTVTLNGIEHVFSNFGSGTLRGCATYWSEHCTFDPIGFCREKDVLKQKKVYPLFYINSNCSVVTPYDIFANWNSPERSHGTTGTGFWKTIERNQKGIPLNVYDICFLPKKELKKKIDLINSYYNNLSVNLHNNFWMEEFFSSVKRIKQMAWGSFGVITRDADILGNIFIGEEDLKNIVQYKPTRIIFEGSQGLLLDKDSGFFPHVVPSKTNLTNILKMNYKVKDVYLVTRTYQTRHGAGPMTNQDIPLEVFSRYEAATKDNEFQGKLRKTVLDLDLLRDRLLRGLSADCEKYKIRKHLVVSCLDQIKGHYSLTYKGKLHFFGRCTEFVQFIGEKLSIDGDLYGNCSPEAKTIFQIEK